MDVVLGDSVAAECGIASEVDRADVIGLQATAEISLRATEWSLPSSMIAACGPL